VDPIFFVHRVEIPPNRRNRLPIRIGPCSGLLFG
jgi:hypothetical protein